MLRLFICFSLALVGHFYLLQFQLNVDDPIPPELISDDSVSVSLDQYIQKETPPKPDPIPEIEPIPEPQRIEPPQEQPAEVPVQPVDPVPVVPLEKPLKIEKEIKKIKKEVISQPKEVQIKEPPPVEEKKNLDQTVVKPVVTSQSTPVPVPVIPVPENTTASVIKARPLYQYNPKPKYSKIARRRGWEGTVMLLVEVDEKGGVVSVQLQKSCGYKVLDKSALKVVKTWRFIAGTTGGKATSSTVIIPVHFKLRK